MSTSRCIYTYAQLNSNKPPDDLSATLEHIVPYALGGSDGFSIPYCGKKANNDFGRDIDAPFIALPIVGFKRHALGLKSYAGIVPEIRAKGDCVELGTACDVVFPYEAPPYADFGISVAGSIDAGQISFTGSPDRLKGAIQSLIKKADRKGLQLLSDKLQPITTFENAIEAGHSTTGETLHFRLNLGHEEFFIPWTKGLLKMALGLGAIALGESWAFSPEADRLRSCLLGEPQAFSTHGLMGSTTCRIPPDIAAMIGVSPGQHSLAVLPYEDRMIAYISLFGGEMMDAMIDLGNGPSGIKVVNDMLPPHWDCAFRIDPKTRKLTRLSLADVNARLPAD